LEYLVAKEKLYENRAKDWGMMVLDGERSREDVFSDIRKFLISN
jgi:thymidylate kinase